MKHLEYQRLVIAFHGCDRETVEHVLSGGELRPSSNDYDWLGEGIYFWEHGPARAMEWAGFMSTRRHSRVAKPAVAGALIQLGNCFDLLDVRYTELLRRLFPVFSEGVAATGAEIPRNEDVYHRLDCAFLNWAMRYTEDQAGVKFHTVRGVFVEGEAAFPGGHVFVRSHIQIAVRDPSAIVGYFRPSQVDAGALFAD